MNTKTEEIFPKRLLKLADYLDDFKEVKAKIGIDRFDMSLFKVTYPSCKTSACALGTAGSIPWFRKRGLKALLEYHDNGAKSYSVKVDGDGSRQAHATFFGICLTDVYELFYSGPSTAKQKAKQIRAFVEQRVAEQNETLLISRGLI